VSALNKNKNIIQTNFRSDKIMFKPKAIYHEKGIENYKLGQELLEKYKDIPKIEIENHNNIEEMRKKQNSEFRRYEKKLNNWNKKNT